MEFSTDFDENVSAFREIFWKMVNILQISQFLLNSDKFSSNSDRIVDRALSRKVQMVRSIGDRTFQPRAVRFQAAAACARSVLSALPSCARPSVLATCSVALDAMKANPPTSAGDFRRFVLGHINADFGHQIVIFQHCSRSAHFCTGRN